MALIEVFAAQPEQRFEHLFGAPPFPQDHRAVEAFDPDIETGGAHRLELVHGDAGRDHPAIQLRLYGSSFSRRPLRLDQGRTHLTILAWISHRQGDPGRRRGNGLVWVFARRAVLLG